MKACKKMGRRLEALFALADPIKVALTQAHALKRRQADTAAGNGSAWWWEAPDEPAREDARPTGSCKGEL